jgi:hypothetical protein
MEWRHLMLNGLTDCGWLDLLGVFCVCLAIIMAMLWERV